MIDDNFILQLAKTRTKKVNTIIDHRAFKPAQAELPKVEQGTVCLYQMVRSRLVHICLPDLSGEPVTSVSSRIYRFSKFI